MGIEFRGLANPRKENGDLGTRFRCHACGAEIGAGLVLDLEHKNRYTILCKRCLNQGEKVINKTILSGEDTGWYNAEELHKL